MDHQLDLRRMRLYAHFLLRAVPGQGRAVRREAGIMDAQLRLLQGAPEWRGSAGRTAGSRHRCRRAVSGTANVRLATSVCHRDRVTCDQVER